jgi:hypothetical protein
MSDEPVKGGPRLTVVGTGIHPGHATVETLEVMKAATKLFYGSDESKWVKELRPDAESLAIFREPQKDRYTTYEEMAEHLLSAVRRGDDVAAAFYGDASIATWPAVNAIRRARGVIIAPDDVIARTGLTVEQFRRHEQGHCHVVDGRTWSSKHEGGRNLQGMEVIPRDRAAQTEDAAAEKERLERAKTWYRQTMPPPPMEKIK